MSVLTEGKPSELFARFRKLSPKVTGSLVRMREESYAEGVIPT